MTDPHDRWRHGDAMPDGHPYSGQEDSRPCCPGPQTCRQWRRDGHCAYQHDGGDGLGIVFIEPPCTVLRDVGAEVERLRADLARMDEADRAALDDARTGEVGDPDGCDDPQDYMDEAVEAVEEDDDE